MALGGRGRKEEGDLTWSDKSTWRFTNWESWSDSEGDCVRIKNGKWRATACSSEKQFVCQKKSILKGEKTLSLTFAEDQLNFTKFLVSYKYKAASDQVLDSWKDKRMTGFRLSWRIENPPLIANISEVGRSIETPHFGDTLDETHSISLDKLYKVTLTPPKNLSHHMTNKNLVIELHNKNPSDEVYAFTSDRLYKEIKKWTDADLCCKREGGQLASIHSQWEQTLAEKAAEGHSVWLGGRKVDGQWQWADNATWSFENWKSDYPKSRKNLKMDPTGEWFDYKSSDRNYFLCQGITVALRESGPASIELNKKQLAFFPFHVSFKSHAIHQGKFNTTSKAEKKGSGFIVNWFLKDTNGTKLTAKLPAKQEDWKQETPTPSYKRPLLHEMVQLAWELKLQNMTKREIFQEVIRQKSKTIVVTKYDEMCSHKQIKADEQKILSKIFSKVNTTKTSGEPSVEDIETGYDLFHAVVFCPPSMEFKIYAVLDKLLSDETTRTLTHTIVNLFLSGAISEKDTSFTMLSDFYNVLANTLDLEYGNILLATSTTAQLKNVICKKWPFLSNNTDVVEKCLVESACDATQDIFQNLGNLAIFFLVSNILPQMPTTSLKSCPSTLST